MRISISRPRLRRIAAAPAAVIVALTVVLAAASGASATKSSAPKPKKGGTLTIMAGGPLNSWDPATLANTIPGVQADRYSAIYGTLIWIDDKGVIQPGMAKSLTSNDKGATWTLTLRPHLKFTDGTPYDAAAVKYNWDRVANPATGAISSSFATTFTTKVVNATTLKITLDQPDPTFALRIAQLLPFIASPASLKSEGALYTKPVGAGPYMLSNWQQGVTESVVRNPGYWDAKQLPYFNQITWNYVSDPTQRVANVVAGTASYMNGYTWQFQQQLSSPGVSAYKVPTGGLRIFIFNMRQAPFNNVLARQAVAYAVSANALDQSLTQEPTGVGWKWLFPSSSPFYNKSIALPSQDTAKAQALVDKLTNNGANPLKFTITIAAVPELERAGQLLQITLNRIKGMQASLKVIPLGNWQVDAYTNHDFDITFYPGIYDLASPEVAVSSLLGPNGAGNYGGYASAVMNLALTRVRDDFLSPMKTRVAAWNAVEKQFVKDVPLVIFGVDYRAFFHSNKIAGFTPMDSGTLNLQDLYSTQ
jgi:peptide/nickel transport system substrate-binding protein